MTAIEDVVILCGGRGTRLQSQAQSIPKPLVEIGGRPIVWHVIRLHAAQGLTRFWLLTGHQGDLVKAFARDCAWPRGVSVRCLDTGADTPTGGRVHLAAPLLEGRPFCLSYADGVADMDLQALIACHGAHDALATMTVVRPELQFGIAEIDGKGRVRGFREKPRAEHWVNGGYFCLNPGALAYIGEDTVLERAPLERLAADGHLQAYRHEGFWDCMDTYKDAVLLNDLWDRGEAPWKVWG